MYCVSKKAGTARPRSAQESLPMRDYLKFYIDGQWVSTLR